jgi:hypothetical protein
VGTGIQILGGSQNTVKNNYLYDNWRAGVRLSWMPAPIRLEVNPADLFDTSNRNRMIDNKVGVDPNGQPRPNGVDFWWDGEGVGNCWSGNTGPAGRAPTSDPADVQILATCPGGSAFSVGDALKLLPYTWCVPYDPKLLPDPPGCDIIKPPPRPA